MKLTKSQTRLLDKLKKIPTEELTEEDLEDIEELEQIEKEQTKDETKSVDLSDLKKGMEEILKCLKPQKIQQEKVEIPTPKPIITNQELDQDQDQESKMKKILKAIW